jgi:DNA-binding PadR family transcriptional regulator
MKTKLSSEYALLGALYSGPKHGYEILKFLSDSLGSTWHIAPSQLYMILKRLEKDSLLMGSLKEQSNRPSKRIFTLTSSGRENFLLWLRSPNRHVRDIRVEFIAKLFFFNSLSIPGAKYLVASQIDLLETSKRKLQARHRIENAPFERLSLKFRIDTVDTCLSWLSNDAMGFVERYELQ